MILASCPRCSESIRFPEVELPGDAQAKCPWCQEVFSAGDVSDQLPPMVELFDGAGIPIESLAIAATGVSFASKSAFVADASSASHFELEELDAGEAGQDEMNQHDEAEAFDDISEVDDDTTPSTLDHSAETWTDDGEPTEHHFASDDTIAIENVTDEADDFAEEGLAGDFSIEHEPSSAFFIEEDGPISEESYEMVSDEPIGFDSAKISHGVAPMHVRSKSRGRGKSSNFKTLLGIALGPILALPIAGLIFYLWGTDLGFWPLDGGRSKNASVRASQPMGIDHFDPRSATDATRTRATEMAETSGSDLLPAATTVTSTQPDDSFTPSQGGNDRTIEDDDVALDRSFWAPPELAEDVAVGDTDSQKKDANETLWEERKNTSVTNDTPGIPLELPSDANVKSDDSVKSNAKAVEKPASEEALPKKKKSASLASEPPIVDSEPPVDSALAEAVSKAKKFLENLDALGKTSSNYGTTLAWTYAAIAELGDQENGDAPQPVIDLLSELKSSTHLNDFGVATPQWLLTNKRKTDGVILVGRPGSNANGPTITLPSGDEISVKTDSVAMPGGDKVVALGRIERQSPHVVVRIVAVEAAN